MGWFSLFTFWQTTKDIHDYNNGKIPNSMLDEFRVDEDEIYFDDLEEYDNLEEKS